MAGRLIGIDYGTKRVGLAVTDPLQMIATALDTIHAKEVIDFLKAYVVKEPVEAFVVGMPKQLNGEDTNNTIPVKQFVAKLKQALPDYPIFYVDERFTSKMALQTMIAMGTKKKDRRKKENIDKISATIILQTFLETKHT
ncbi:MAG: Holliday junction resolvase RuvX [Thermonemataceae bacterium]